MCPLQHCEQTTQEQERFECGSEVKNYAFERVMACSGVLVCVFFSSALVDPSQGLLDACR